MDDLSLAHLQNAKPHVSWCIWHEGCTVYVPLFDGGLVPEPMESIQSIRAQMMAFQDHNGTAKQLITRLNDNDLISVIESSCAEIPEIYNLKEHFRWVCYHEGWMPEFRVWSASGSFGDIRGKYHSMQQHNPNARSLLASIRDSELKALIDSL
ncbi:hypothetical protein PSH58_18160 [Pseudomonas hefeiensis]|uniref:Uncharacterized protein n=1 Tax=Pseudomonas hefeiensis TaxID=2738125 RepID=A0ABY9G5A3_9PSED|nr:MULTISPECIES: hypothetical protein [unclassified Pseudomonas]WLH10800.1 hypothetical protein PSH57_18130 [Pseudomonas sp. FP205]WLH93881.1 hypothetical protein PSH58_18160 [Pseudomonas sp. FP53]WLI38156.1 hypothetical protein PSH74_18090 [Pseudomonas sp. FP821]